MKKLVVLAAVALTCVGAFAQGKVSFRNDQFHLVYYSPLISDASLAGKPVAAGSGYIVDLYAGATSSSLAKIASTTIVASGTPGTFGPVSVNTVPFTTRGWFQIVVNSPDTQWTGSSIKFEATPSTGIAYNSLVQLTSPALSTWTAGSFNLDAVSPGFRGAIEMVAVPEPSSFALAGLGAAALLIFRRRN